MHGRTILRWVAYHAIKSLASALVRVLCQLPIYQQAPVLVRQNDVPRVYITMQDIRDIEYMRVSFAFISVSGFVYSSSSAHLEPRQRRL